MLRIKKRALLLVAALVWLSAGVNILRIGISAILSTYGKGSAWWNLGIPLFAFLVFVGFTAMFYRIVDKHERRIVGYEAEKVSIFLFFDLKGYLMMAFMMGLGITLCQGGFMPEVFFAFFYTGLGSALSLAGLRFGVRFFRLTLRQILWIGLGLWSVGLGTLGIFLPILPTVPLYLLGSFSFLSSSKKLHKKFQKSRPYIRFLKPYLDANGLTKKAKIRLGAFVTLQIVIAGCLVRDSVWGLVALGILYLGFVFSMIFAVKTIPPIAKSKSQKEN
ncbi:MAG: DUF454 family protein [Clostridia bacterium]|nr:DUF454 family protein [Clostridia bacterium]